MGRQVNFYMTHEDEQEFLGFVRSTGTIAVFMTTQDSAELLELNELPAEDVEGAYFLCFWNKDISPHPKLKFITEQNHYCVDKMESEVVEFLRCVTIDQRLNPGRIWTEITYWDLNEDPPVMIRKPPAFEKWYNKLAAWLRKHGTRSESGYFIMPEASHFVHRGHT